VHDAGGSVTRIFLEGLIRLSDTGFSEYVDGNSCQIPHQLLPEAHLVVLSPMESIYRSHQDEVSIPAIVSGVFNILKNLISGAALQELQLDCSVWSTHHRHFARLGTPAEPSALDLLFRGPKWLHMRSVKITGLLFDVASPEAFLDHIDGGCLRSVTLEESVSMATGRSARPSARGSSAGNLTC